MATVAVATPPGATAPAGLQVPTSPAARSTGSPLALAGVPASAAISVAATRASARTIRPTRPLRGEGVKGMLGNSTPDHLMPSGPGTARSIPPPIDLVWTMWPLMEGSGRRQRPNSPQARPRPTGALHGAANCVGRTVVPLAHDHLPPSLRPGARRCAAA